MRIFPNAYLGDIYDGRIWHEFNSPIGHNFLSVPMSSLLRLNVGWFQPFLHTQYSVGAMYLTIHYVKKKMLYS